PVDFSHTSLNAARYAAQMLSGHDDVQIILYNMFSHADDGEVTRNYLDNLKTELLHKGDKEIECFAEHGHHFIDGITKLAKLKATTLVVMGITGKSETDEVYMGSNTLTMVDKNVCPVMIIPPDATFNEIKNVAFTSDFKNVEKTTPVNYIKAVLELFKADLHIINVDSGHYVSITDEYKAERDRMEELFKEYTPDFYFFNMFAFHETINQFVFDKNIDLIVTVPRYHSFLSSVFKATHTKKLVYHSIVPILAAHE
ncbi:MAG: universal stress protein, partial [Bacteroidota bacterium]|nr:universal stress protein [Bacteroidota bacterium]